MLSQQNDITITSLTDGKSIITIIFICSDKTIHDAQQQANYKT